MSERTKKDAIKGAFFGALVGDALCLGSHYEYDAKKIYEAYAKQSIEKFMSLGEMVGGQRPIIGWGERNYHPGKKAGETTDYGDYNILVLEHLATTLDPPREFDVATFIPHWMKRLTNNWGSWICDMTRETFAQVQAGKYVDQLGGSSNAMAIRHVAAHAYYDDEATLVKVARKVMFTHSNEEALSGAEFFARVTHRVINGMAPSDAIELVAVEMGGFITSKVSQAMDKYQEATNERTELSHESFVDDLALTSMAKLWHKEYTKPNNIGKDSPTEGTLPGAVYFILKYGKQEDGLKKALQANTMVGGDNASRAIAIGMVLGAYKGVDAIPNIWKVGLDEWEYCEGLLQSLPLLKG